MSFSVLIGVGGGPLEMERLHDLLASLFHYEPAVAEIVIVDDVMPARTFAALPMQGGGCRLVVLPNPRCGRGDGWLGGLTAGILAGYAWLERNSRCDFVVKLDTDSLVIAPFAEKVAAAFAAQPETFIFGSTTRTPNRVYDKPEDFSVAPALEKLMRPLTIWRRTCDPWPRVQCCFYGRDKRRRETIVAAVRSGYRLGIHAQGGGYAVSRRGLSRMAAGGIFMDPLLWIWAPCSEDVVMTISAFACGGRAGDLNANGEPFGTLSRGLPDTPPRLVERGFSIIHSVKDFEGAKEAEIRQFFRERRS